MLNPLKPYSNQKGFPDNIQNWFQNLQLGLRSRRSEEFNRRNISNILRIEFLTPTKRFDPREVFETSSGT